MGLARRTAMGFGLGVLVVGSVAAIFAGLVLSATIIGAIVGVPLIIAGCVGLGLLWGAKREADESGQGLLEHVDNEYGGPEHDASEIKTAAIILTVAGFPALLFPPAALLVFAVAAAFWVWWYKRTGREGVGMDGAADTP